MSFKSRAVSLDTADESNHNNQVLLLVLLLAPRGASASQGLRNPWRRTCPCETYSGARSD